MYTHLVQVSNAETNFPCHLTKSGRDTVPSKLGKSPVDAAERFGLAEDLHDLSGASGGDGTTGNGNTRLPHGASGFDAGFRSELAQGIGDIFGVPIGNCGKFFPDTGEISSGIFRIGFTFLVGEKFNGIFGLFQKESDFFLTVGKSFNPGVEQSCDLVPASGKCGRTNGGKRQTLQEKGSLYIQNSSSAVYRSRKRREICSVRQR